MIAHANRSPAEHHTCRSRSSEGISSEQLELFLQALQEEANETFRAGKELEINPDGKGQAYSRPLTREGHVLVVADANGAHMANLSGTMEPVTITGKGAGSGSEIAYDPASFPNAKTSGSPSDVVLAHEMNHSANTAEGGGQAGLKDADPDWNKKWDNREEKDTVDSENRYREQRGGVPERPDYRTVP